MSSTSERIFRFKDYRAFPEVEEKLKSANVPYSRRSTTVSYFLQDSPTPKLESYELHATYEADSSSKSELTPEFQKSYVLNSYSIVQTAEGKSWVAESSGRLIQEKDFYYRLLYSKPSRVMNIQQISFVQSKNEYLIELNVESKVLVLVRTGEREHVPGLIADMLLPAAVNRSAYLLELFAGNGGALSS